MLLSADALTRTSRGRAVVDRVSLRVNRGEVVGVFGKYGAGKTSLLEMLSGLAGVDSGRVEFLDRNVTSLSIQARARLGLVLVPDRDSVFRRMTVTENLRAIDPECETAALLQEYGLTNVVEFRAESLGSGQRKRLQMCRAMLGSPSLLMLDEPFSGLDPMHVAGVADLIRRLPLRGTSVLFSDHNVRESINLCNRAYILHEGRVMKEGTPGDIVA